MNKTIQELDQITLANDDLFPIWDTSAGDTKKGSVSDLKSKIVGTVDSSPNPSSQNLINSQAVANAVSYCHSSNTVVNGSPLFNGCVVKIMFTENITGSDTTTPLTITYNGTPITVKVNKNGTLADLTANQVELPDANNNLRSLEKSENEEETKEAEEETENIVQTRSIKSGGSESLRTTTAYLYCQAYTTLELLYNGTNFIVFGNPVVISNADYTIYTDGTIEYTTSKVDSLISNKVIYEFRSGIADDLPAEYANGNHFLITFPYYYQTAQLAIAPMSNNYSAWAPPTVLLVRVTDPYSGNWTAWRLIG